MSLSKEEVLKLARLSRLSLTGQEVEHYQKEISAILQYIDVLDSAKLDDLKPTYQVTGLTNVMRSDEIDDYGTTQQDLLKNVPKTENKLIKVKRMVG